MKRSFLKDLELADEQISSIMKEHGEAMQKYKETMADYTEEIKELKAKVIDIEKASQDAVKKYKEENKEQLEKASKYDALNEELSSLKLKENERVYTEALNNFLVENKIEFTNEYAKKDILNRFKEKSFKLNEDKFNKDALDFINDLKENEKEAFKIIEEQTNANQVNEPNTIPSHQPFFYEPKAGNSQDVVDSILGSIFG